MWVLFWYGTHERQMLEKKDRWEGIICYQQLVGGFRWWWKRNSWVVEPLVWCKIWYFFKGQDSKETFTYWSNWRWSYKWPKSSGCGDRKGFCNEIYNTNAFHQGKDLIITYGNHPNNTMKIRVFGKFSIW